MNPDQTAPLNGLIRVHIVFNVSYQSTKTDKKADESHERQEIGETSLLQAWSKFLGSFSDSECNMVSGRKF